MTNEDLKIIRCWSKHCGSCTHYRSDLVRPPENSFETWFDHVNGDCSRYPPVFVGGSLDSLTDDYEFASENYQMPKVHSFTPMCGEFSLASWIPVLEIKNPD